VQRLLCTIDGLVVWGENFGITGLLAEATERLGKWESMSARQREGFEAKGDHAWIANMGPPIEQLDELTRDWLQGLYGPATRALGKTRWGFKEVRHDARIADFLVSLFPAGKVILLLRNPVDVLASNRSTSWSAKTGGGERLGQGWCNRVESFVAARERHVLLRYEDLVSRAQETLARLEASLGVAPGSIDPGPLDVVVTGPRRKPPHIGSAEIRALRQPRMIEVARQAGYDIKGDPRLSGRSFVRSILSKWSPDRGEIPTLA
jgi:hypothetical protein